MFCRRGFSLLEVLVASVVLVVITLSFILSLVYAGRASALSALETSAAHLLQGRLEAIRADEFDSITPARYQDVLTSSPNPIFLDAEERVPVTITYDILSTFSVSSATNTSITVTGIPVNRMRNGEFVADEFKGNVLTIVSGTGMTLSAWIKSNTATDFQVTGDLTGQTSQDLELCPDSSSVVQLNHGKVVRVRLSWFMGNREYTREISTLVLPKDL